MCVCVCVCVILSSLRFFLSHNIFFLRANFLNPRFLKFLFQYDFPFSSLSFILFQSVSVCISFNPSCLLFPLFFFSNHFFRFFSLSLTHLSYFYYFPFLFFVFIVFFYFLPYKLFLQS